jgi:ParB/RepB/Spo0J family partition protein
MATNSLPVNSNDFGDLSWKAQYAQLKRQTAAEAAQQTRALSTDMQLVPLAEIKEDSPGQCRLKPFAADADEYDRGLVESIEAIGLHTPVILVALKAGGYRIEAGHRRAAAMRYLGKAKIPAVVVPEGTPGLDPVAVSENVRKDLLTIERLHQLEWLRDTGHSKEDIARTTGITVRQLDRFFQLSNLPPEIRAIMEQGRIALKSAVAVCRAPLAYQAEVMGVVVEGALTEGQTSALVNAVTARLTEAGPEGVDVRQIARGLRLPLMAGAQGPEADGQMAEDEGRMATSAGEAPDAAAQTPGRRQAQKPKSLAEKAARELLQGYFPGLSAPEVTALVGETTRRRLTEKVVRLAGMAAASGRLKAGEAVQAAQRIERRPEAKHWLVVLETGAEVRSHLESGGDPALNEPFIAFGAQLCGELLKQTAQAKKKK